MYKQIAANKRHTILIMLGFIVLIMAIGGIFAYVFQDWFILLWVSVIAIGYAVFQYFASGNLAVAMTGAREIQKKDNPRLYNAVENISIATGLPMPKVYLITDPAPNAFASGRDPQHAIVAATTGLVDIMDKTELEAVMAHEMSHIKNYDIRLSTIVFGLVSAIGLLSDLGLRMRYFGGGRSSRDSDDQSPIGIVILIVTALLAPLAASLIQLAVSREREYLADASAAHILRNPDAMIDALKKLNTHTRPMRQQNSATAALFIANPLKKGFFSDLFNTHPSLEKRIERLEYGKTTF